MTLKEGPPGIETQRHVDEVVAPLYRAIEREQADAFIIACFSDPGLHAAREVASAPVFGIAQCGMLAALARGERFGIVAILETSIPRHRRYVASLGLSDRMAGERAIGLGVTELAQEDIVATRMTEAAERLQDEDGADVIVPRLRRHGALPGTARSAPRLPRHRPLAGRGRHGARHAPQPAGLN